MTAASASQVSMHDPGTPLMKKVAVFGNTGGGKSTLARRLGELTGLPLYPLDLIEFKAGGVPVPREEYLNAHADILRRDVWIIDGFGDVASAWERFAAADTLIHVDLPLFIHFRWITKRLIKGLFADPPGWPENSALWSSSVQS
jgi:adenylate kinase family enzyme